MAQCPATQRSGRRIETVEAAMHSQTQQRSEQATESDLTLDVASHSELPPPTPRATEDVTLPSLPPPRQPFRRLTEPQPVALSPARDDSRRLGLALLGLGSTGLIAAAVLSTLEHRVPAELWGSSLIALCFGSALCRPSLLCSDSNAGDVALRLSATRISAVLILPAFALTLLKTSWNASSLGELKLDPAWVYLVGAVLLSEILLSFAQRLAPTR
jgi:hypothetical protein